VNNTPASKPALRYQDKFSLPRAKHLPLPTDIITKMAVVEILRYAELQFSAMPRL